MGRRARARSASAQLAIEPLERRLYLAVAMINWTDVRQTIAGFGSSSAWNNLGNVDSSQQQLLWSTTDGAGLSMLRSRIRPDTSSSSDEIFAMQKAQAMGVTIWSTPWSPPAAWKSNNNIATIVNGVDTMGYLLASHYQDYANWLKQYVINMANNGITIYAVSMQNEPNWSADYESARWSAQQFHDALSVLHDTLASDSRTANVKIILPEEIHWNNLDLVSQVMSDPVESNYTNVIYADHTYGINTIAGGKDGFAPISGLNGHQIWETEHTGDDPGLGITAGLNEAQSIYDIIYIAQASAYHHWWTNATGGAGLLNGQWQTTKLFSAITQFSKFIRPGWVAVGESDDNNGLRISAFKNPATGDFASVIVNTGSSAITETIHLNGAYAPVITPWITTATLDVAQQQSVPATGDGSSFTYTIPAKSIVTLTGTATTTPVTEAPVGLLATGATTGTIALSWTNNLTSAAGYTVQRSNDGTNWTTLSNTLPSGTYTYTDSGLPANTLYYYRVQANNGTLFSDVVAQMTQPPAPSNLTASYSASTQNVTLNWTRNGSSATDYAVDVSADGGNTWTTQSAGISSSSSSYTDTAVPELATLQYRVRAVYGLNASAPTNVVTVTSTVLKAPSGLSISASGKSAVLKWTDNTATNSTVSIERSTDGTNWAVLTSVNHGVQTYTDSTLAEGGTYYYRIRNYDSAATPPTYSAYATASAVTVPPAAPTHVEVEFSPLPTFTAGVLWVDNATSDTAYEVDRSSDGGSTWTTLSTTLPANSTTYTDTTVTAGQSYEYRVEALHNGLSSTSVTTLSETASSLPAPFAHGDIGDATTVGLAGSASYASSTGRYTLTGAGSDIWNTADGFQFAFTTLTGDGSIVTQVTSMANFLNSGKAGIMMRNSLDPSSAYAIAFLTPQGTANFEERASSGASSANRASQGTFSTPELLKLTRSGNAFSAFYSADGVSWTQLGSSFTIAMGSTIYVGLITSAHSSSQLATATFANTALTGTGNQPPTVSTPAAASQLPAPNAASANLSVLGADDAGESNLTYSWATTATPPAPVVFSSNGQNASKNTVATFLKPGNYSFVVTITDQFGLTTTSTVDFTLNQVTNTIVVSPSGATVAPNSQKQFTATAYDQFGAALMSQPSFTWSTPNSNLGSINAAAGLYSASSLQGISTVSATAGAINGSATLNVTSLPAPLAWYRFDETSGSIASDSSGNGKNATLSGNAAFGTGESGDALALTGGYASLPAGIMSTLTNFTISAWVNVTTLANWARIFDFGTGTTDYMFLTPDAGGTNAIRFGITTSGAGGEQQLNGPAITANNWTHIAVTLVGSTGTLYVNGVAVATNTGMTLHPSTLGNTNQNYFGKSQYADPALQGSIDDVRIFSAGLPAAQITQLYNSYFPPTVAAAAAATPATVSATTCQLSALGASNLGESALAYTWSAIGTPPAPVTFSANGTNAAKNTVATFSKVGTYTLGVTMADTYGQNVTSSVTVTVNQTLTAIVVSPVTSSLTSGQTEMFAATALDQFNNPLVVTQAFTWSVDPGSLGTVDASGLYTAPLSPVGSAMVRATSGAISGTAAVSVNYLKGDINFDGHRDGADIVAFMQAITNVSGYQTQQGLSNQDLLTIADINGDNHVNNADLQYLINLLVDGGGSTSAGSAISGNRSITLSNAAPSFDTPLPPPTSPSIDARPSPLGYAGGTAGARPVDNHRAASGSNSTRPKAVVALELDRPTIQQPANHSSSFAASPLPAATSAIDQFYEFLDARNPAGELRTVSGLEAHRPRRTHFQPGSEWLLDSSELIGHLFVANAAEVSVIE